MISTGVLGLFDATVGLKLSMQLHANIGNQKVELTPTLFITTAIFMSLFAVLHELLGWWLSTQFTQTK